MKLSIVTSLYRSEPYLAEFLRRAAEAARPLAGEDFEVIFVNDGSPDNSLETALRLRRDEPRLTVVDLARNFGHHHALMAGIRRAAGERVFLIDVDLEEPPELLGELWRVLEEHPEADVAYGVQRERKGGWFERWSGRLFYRVMRLLSPVDYPADTLTARLMSRRYVESLKLFRDREFDLWVNFALAGFVQLPVEAVKTDKGSSSYTFGRKLRHALESVTSSSAAPLYGIFLLGMAVFLTALGYLGFLVVNKIFWEVPVGWSMLAASIWGMGGMIMISIGTVGIYLGRVFVECKQRPEVIVRRVYGPGEEP